MAQARNQLRIVGGRFRGRRLPFPDQPGLRPTADRVRETLFNWLTPLIAGARCLDAFAGSGALGLEAASRGAAHVVMLERAAPVVRQLEANARTLGATEIEIHRADALEWLSRPAPAAFDIVFLDPPFADGLLEPAIERLRAQGWIRRGSHVYLESSARDGIPGLAPGWELHREKRAGQVSYALAIARDPADSEISAVPPA